jgi:hypothetical protein
MTPTPSLNRWDRMIRTLPASHPCGDLTDHATGSALGNLKEVFAWLVKSNSRRQYSINSQISS